jgi:hypothetical protein
MDTSVAYGIDQTGESLTVVKARASRRDVSFETVYQAQGPCDIHKAADAVSSLAETGSSRSAVVSASMPASSAVTRWLETPFSAPGKAMRVLPSVLDVQLPFPLESCVYSFASLEKEPGKGCRALALASRRDDVSSRLEQLGNCGIDPWVLDHEALALWHRAAQEQPPKAGEYRVIGHTGPSAWTLVVGKGAGFLSSHTFRVTHRDVDAASIAPRIQRVLRSQCGGSDTGIDWMWAGSGIAEAPFRTEIETALQRDRQIQFRVAKKPETFLARALAAHALTPDIAQWNLRYGELEHPGWIEVRSRARRSAAFTGIVVGVLLIATNLGWRGVLDHRNDDLQARITTLASELTGLPADKIPRGFELHAVTSGVADPRKSADPFSRALAPGVSDTLYHLAATAAAKGLFIAEFRTEDDRASFEMRGSAESRAACESAQADLSRNGIDVELILPDASDTDSVRYILRGDLQSE